MDKTAAGILLFASLGAVLVLLPMLVWRRGWRWLAAAITLAELAGIAAVLYFTARNMEIFYERQQELQNVEGAP